MSNTPYTAPAGLKVGHVHLKVSDLAQSIAFYRDVLGFEVQQMYGEDAAFLAAGGYHHHLGLNTWESRGGSAPDRGLTGLYHVAFLYPDRASLGRAVKEVLRQGVTLTGAADHGVSEAVYFNDPDGNGIELYWDRPDVEWPRTETGELRMVNARLNLEELTALA